MGECFFYWFTRIVPDKIHRAVKWLCVCKVKSLDKMLKFIYCEIHMVMETLVLKLSGSSHASSPPSGSKPASNCCLIPLLSTPACARGISSTDTASAPTAVVQNTTKSIEQTLLLHTDLASVLKGVVAFFDVQTECDNRSCAVESVLWQLGAEVASKISKDVMHVVFKDGKKRTRRSNAKTAAFGVSAMGREV